MLDELVFYQTLHKSDISECGTWLQAFEESYLQLLVVRPANRGVESSIQDTLIKRMAQIAQEALKPLYSMRAAIMDGALYLVVCHSMNPEDFRMKTAITMDEIAHQVISLFGSSTLYAVSRAFPRNEHAQENALALRQMVQECEQCFEEAFLQSQSAGGMWYMQSMPAKDNSVALIPVPLENSIMTYISNGKTEDAWSSLCQYLNEQLYNQRSSFERMWKLLVDGVDILYKAVAAENMPTQEVLGDYSQVCDKLKMAMSYTDALQILHGLFSQVDAAVTKRTIGLPVSKQILDAFLREHWIEDISLSMASEHWHLSEGYFSEVVRKLTGKSFPDYLSWQRIQFAMKLMEDRSLTITEISVRAGFNNYKTFSRCFSKFYQTTPSDYRRALAEKALSSET